VDAHGEWPYGELLVHKYTIAEWQRGRAEH